MTEIEARILHNQTEILWTLKYLIQCAKPDLVGRNGEVDRMIDDLRQAARETATVLAHNT